MPVVGVPSYAMLLLSFEDDGAVFDGRGEDDRGGIGEGEDEKGGEGGVHETHGVCGFCI